MVKTVGKYFRDEKNGKLRHKWQGFRRTLFGLQMITSNTFWQEVITKIRYGLQYHLLSIRHEKWPLPELYVHSLTLLSIALPFFLTASRATLWRPVVRAESLIPECLPDPASLTCATIRATCSQPPRHQFENLIHWRAEASQPL